MAHASCLCLTSLSNLANGLGGQNVQISASHSRNGSDIARFDRLSKGAQRVGEIQHQSRNGLRCQTELMIRDIAANDVLNIREYATSNSTIVGIIPPNSRGVIYLGERQ